MLLPTFLATIPDHRRPQGRLYALGPLLLFSILAILSDAKSYRDWEATRCIGASSEER
jgi:hypothetical protein